LVLIVGKYNDSRSAEI